MVDWVEDELTVISLSLPYDTDSPIGSKVLSYNTKQGFTVLSLL